MKISIITATFNSGKTIVDTMVSVLRQTYTNFEYLVIDGGSSDDRKGEELRTSVRRPTEMDF